jgi:hypothetical protein
MGAGAAEDSRPAVRCQEEGLPQAQHSQVAVQLFHNVRHSSDDPSPGTKSIVHYLGLPGWTPGSVD